MIETLKIIDEYFFKLINSSGWESMDTLMSYVSSKSFWIPLYIYLIYLLWQKFPEQFVKILCCIVILIFLADYGSVHLFKEIVERPRPCYEDIDGLRVVNECGGAYGFISSHASNVFSLTFFVFLMTRNKILFVSLFLWSVLVGYSRVYLGVHYPLDIVGGMLWGLFVSLLTYSIYYMKVKKIDLVWFVWLALVCIWNFVWPEVPAIADVIVAVLLSLGVVFYKNFKKSKK